MAIAQTDGPEHHRAIQVPIRGKPWCRSARSLLSLWRLPIDPDAAAHPWIERDTATGAQSLKMPLPPPETARQLANALSALADGLRGKIA